MEATPELTLVVVVLVVVVVVSMRSMEVGNYWGLSRTLFTTTGHRFEGPQPGALRARARVRGVVALREKRGAWVGVLVRSVTGVDSVFLWVGTLGSDLGVDFRLYFKFF